MGVGLILTTDWPDSSFVPCQNSSLGDYGSCVMEISLEEFGGGLV
jgi:hypothetical protein